MEEITVTLNASNVFGGSVAGEKTGLETMECDTYH